MYFGDNLRGVTGEWLGKKTDEVSFPSNPGLFKTSLAVQTMGGGHLVAMILPRFQLE